MPKHHSSNGMSEWRIVNLLGMKAYFCPNENGESENNQTHLTLKSSGELRFIREERTVAAERRLARLTGNTPIVTPYYRAIKIKVGKTQKTFRQQDGVYYLVFKDIAETTKWIQSMHSEYFIYPKQYYVEGGNIYIRQLGMIYSSALWLAEPINRS